MGATENNMRVAGVNTHPQQTLLYQTAAQPCTDDANNKNITTSVALDLIHHTQYVMHNTLILEY